MRSRFFFPVAVVLLASACPPADVGEGEGGDEGEGEGDVVAEGEGEGDVVGEGEGEGEGEGDVLTVVVDEDSRVSVDVGPAGGTVEVGGNVLVVPPGALAETVTISMALAQAAELPGASLVDLEPEGLSFLEPASLTLAAATAESWVVRFDAGGVAPHLVPRSRDVGVTVRVGHFSGAGVGTGAPPTFAPSAAEAAALNAVAQIEIAEASSGVPNVVGRAAALRPWLAQLNADIAAVDALVEPWDRALAEANDLAVVVGESGLDDDVNLGAEFGPVADDLAAALRKALGRIAADRRRVALAAHDHTLELAVGDIVFPRTQGRFLAVQANDPLLSATALARDSLVDVVFHDVNLRETPDADDDDLIVSGRVVAVFAGDTLVNAPLDATVLVGQGNAVGGGVVDRDADGRFEIVVDPNAGASRVVVVVNAAFTGFPHYQPEANSVVSKEAGSPVRLVLRVGSRGTDGFAAVLPGDSVVLNAVLLQGDGAQETGAPGRAVSFAVDGPGFVEAGATTDGLGVARATFIAGNDDATSTVRATVDPGDGPPLTATLEISVSPVRVTLEPALSIVSPGTEVELTATLSGTDVVQNFGLSYGSDGGAFATTPTGVRWTAPGTPGRYQLRASSAFDPRASAVSDLVVLVPGAELVADVVIEAQPCDGPLVRDVVLRAFDGGEPAAGVSLRITRDGFVRGTLTTNGDGEAHYGRRPAPDTQLIIEWVEGSTLIAVVDVMTDYPAEHGNPCSPCPSVPVDACPSSRTDFQSNPLINDEGDACACQAAGCCAGDRCYHNGDC